MGISREERRRFPRVNLHAPIRYQIKGEPEFDNSVSDDVSVGGLSFLSETYIPPATDLILELNISSRVLNLVGTTVWSAHLPHSDRSRVGVEFKEFDPFEQDYLRDYLQLLRQLS